MSLIFQEKFTKTKLLKNFIGISSRDPTPCLWDLNENFDNISVYLNSIIKEQIIFDGFSNKSIEFLDLRAKIVNQIIQICNNFKLKSETLFKSVQIFDIYCWKISKFQTFKVNNAATCTTNDNSNCENIFNSDDQSSLSDLLKELKTIIVLCLNIACKFEEINCSYISYFKEHLLDEDENKEFYQLPDLIKKETEILKIINFKLASPSFYVFNNVYIELVILEYSRVDCNLDKNEIQKFITRLVRINDVIVKVYCTLHESVYISPLYSGLICIKATFIYFEYLYKRNLSYLDNYLSNILHSTNYEIEIDFLERVSNRLFSLIKSKNLKIVS